MEMHQQQFYIYEETKEYDVYGINVMILCLKIILVNFY